MVPKKVKKALPVALRDTLFTLYPTTASATAVGAVKRKKKKKKKK